MQIERNSHPSFVGVRPTSWTILILFVVVKTVLVVLSVTHLHPHFFALARTTGHLLNVNLISFTIIAVVCIGGILMAGGGQTLRDLGLRKSQIWSGVITMIGAWAALQAVLIAHAYFRGELRLHSQWADPGLIPMIGFFVAMLLGAALVEEVAFRGYVFPQIWAKCTGSYRRRIVIAAIGSQVLFAVMHIPTRLVIGGNSLTQLMPSLVVLTLAGLYGVAMYLRTGNLLVVIGIHALINAPSPIVDTSFPPMFIVVVIGLLLLTFWPYITRRPTRWHRLQLVPIPDSTIAEAAR